VSRTNKGNLKNGWGTFQFSQRRVGNTLMYRESIHGFVISIRCQGTRMGCPGTLGFPGTLVPWSQVIFWILTNGCPLLEGRPDLSGNKFLIYHRPDLTGLPKLYIIYYISRLGSSSSCDSKLSISVHNTESSTVVMMRCFVHRYSFLV
jgi:hypothetical protein